MTCLLTIDVEDWFHVENMRGVISPGEWDACEVRVEKNMARILDILDSYGVKATFFVLGWVAERCPGLVREIHERGHEVASHGYAHRLIYHQKHGEFAEDISKSRKLLEEITGEEVLGYRAPSFSITEWAVDILKQKGYLYDSSYCPTSVHNLYGRLNLKSVNTADVFQFQNGLKEFPLPVIDFGGISIPWGGGAYFRLIPYSIFSSGVRRILKKGSYVFYFHPWEIDPGQPRIKNIKLNYRLRQYWGLNQAERKLKKLLGDFSFGSIISHLK